MREKSSGPGCVAHPSPPQAGKRVSPIVLAAACALLLGLSCARREAQAGKPPPAAPSSVSLQPGVPPRSATPVEAVPSFASGSPAAVAAPAAAPAPTSSTAPAVAPQGAAPPAPSPAQAGAPPPAPSPVPAPTPPQAALTTIPPGSAPLPMARSIPAAIASPRSFGLAAPAGPRLPEDYAIGPLEPPRPSDPDRAAALLVIRGFLDSLLAGKTAEDKVAASRRALLRYGVDEILAAARPTAYRVGSILIDGDAALAPLRLEAAAKGVGGALPSRAAGAIYLRYEEGAWSVEDLELDSLALAAKAEPRRPPFEPAVGSSSQRIP